MLAEDRALLARVAKLNQSMGEVVTHLLSRLDPDEGIATDVLRELARHLDLLSAALHARADTTDNTIEEEHERTEITAHSHPPRGADA